MSFLSVVLLLAAANANPPAASEQYAPGQLIVRLTDDCRGLVNPAVNGELVTLGIPEVDRLSNEWGVTRITKIIRDPHPNALAQKYGLDLLYTMIADPTTDVPAMQAAYEQCGRIVYACPNVGRPVDDIPNDPRYANQWHLAQIQAPGAWDVSHGATSVVIGVVDQGVDYTHEDIGANVWINELEDINHNGRFDPYPPPDGDLNGNDDDGNGYIDDVCGYDFQDADPDPMPAGNDDHGQHCFGITDAVTNNGLGVASIGWGCRGLCLRAGAGGLMYMGPCIAAIYYAVEKGTWVTSHSYGSTNPWSAERDAMQYAWDSGQLVIAAAGNDGSQSPHYPAYYDVCIAVAASDHSDHRCSWSDYGTWVDVSAPGTGIVSTVLNNGYAAFDGTSMAAPLVAGLCALMKAADPSLTNQACKEGLFATCDTMPDPDYRAGLMGAGRINAMKALAMSTRSYLTASALHLNDPNHNGIAEPGEVCGLTITLHNASGWQTATGVSAILSSTDSTVTITKNTATFPNIAGGASADCSADSFVFTVSTNAIPHAVGFQLTKAATPPSLAGPDYLRLRVGMPRILLVSDYAGTAIDRWYKEACDSLRLLYDLYNTSSSGAPSSDTLEHYPVVIWYTGLDSLNCVNAACRTALQAYLDNGGKLFICGQNIGQAIGSDPFCTNYLKAQFAAANTGKLFNLGLPGDPIGNGDTIVCGGSGGANNCTSPDGIRPTGGAFGSTIYKDYADTTVYGSVHYAGSYKLVYFGLPFEAIDHATSRYVQKWTILRRIMAFFGEPLPPVTVTEPGAPSLEYNISRSLLVSPNPTTTQARISFGLDRNTAVTVRVYDARGRLVRELAAGTRPAGDHGLTWNLCDPSGKRVAAGIYYCTLTSAAGVRTAKLLVTQ
jgi:subtilisin family serine protease